MKEINLEETSKVKNEESSTKLYKLFNFLMVLFFVLSGIWLYVCIFFNIDFIFEVPIYIAVLIIFLIVILPFVLILATGFVFRFLKFRIYTEYDYVQINETFIISKIIYNSKRKRVLKFSNVQIEKIGRVGSETYEVYLSMNKIKICNAVATGKNINDTNFYYIVFNNDEGKHLVKLDCSIAFIKNVITVSNKLLVEKDF